MALPSLGGPAAAAWPSSGPTGWRLGVEGCPRRQPLPASHSPQHLPIVVGANPHQRTPNPEDRPRGKKDKAAHQHRPSDARRRNRCQKS